MAENNLLVVSDLHLSEGWNSETGRVSRLESFHYDDAFERFIHHHESIRRSRRYKERPWLLIFNGDLFQFAQVVSLPPEGKELRAVTGVSSYDELPRDVLRYGLGTTPKEAAWKVGRIAAGHPIFFAALGWFLAHGNRIAIIKGNHDPEWFWPEVQERFCREILHAYEEWLIEGGSGPHLMLEDVQKRVRFYPWFYYEPGRIYVEHGHQYDPVNRFRNFLHPVQPHRPNHLDLPWGSFVTQTFLNHLQRGFPYADLDELMKQQLGRAIRQSPVRAAAMGLYYLYLVARATLRELRQRRHAGEWEKFPFSTARNVGLSVLPDAVVRRLIQMGWEPHHRAVERVLRIFARAGAATATMLLQFVGIFQAARAFVDAEYLGMLGWAIMAGGVFLLRRSIQLYFRQQVSRVHYGYEAVPYIRQALGEKYEVPYYVFGHMHRPTLRRLEGGKWFVDSGGWPILIRQQLQRLEEKKLTFVRLPTGHRGAPELLYWDDSGNKAERLVLVEPYQQDLAV
ncbi:MAG: metallophosphoesterase [Anaerolineae bacterium]|nr:metallophosphoesterase [Anaerolineae bacterium]